MMKVLQNVGGVALGLLICSALAAPPVLHGQAPTGAAQVDGRWPLQPSSGNQRVIAPFLEGWYVNPDESVSYSFGYNNLNDSTVELPIGDKNTITPAKYDGMQPTVFLSGKHRGMFTVTVPASERNNDVWWTLTNPNGDVTKIPGRTTWSAYMLDWVPRPHGSVPPEVTFEGGQTARGPIARGPVGVVANRSVTTTVGAPTTLAVNVREISVRDTTDARFRDPVSLRVVWTKYQGPVGANVEFTRHESTAVEPPSEGRGGGGGGGGGRGRAPGPEEVMVPSGVGTARVVATFPVAGEYLINAQVDNWRVPDSSSGDQCCWTNGYVRVTVR